jgi:hypothetical protein
MLDTDPTSKPNLSYVGYSTYQLCSLGDIPAEEAESMSVLVPLFPHQDLSETSAWVELDSQTTTQPSNSSLSTKMVSTAT